MSKELEALENIIETFYDKDSEDIQIVRKALEAFEIIKKKGVLVNGLIKSKDLGEYNTLCNYYQMSELLTQEEYDLLKEVLNDLRHYCL